MTIDLLYRNSELALAAYSQLVIGDTNNQISVLKEIGGCRLAIQYKYSEV